LIAQLAFFFASESAASFSTNGCAQLDYEIQVWLRLPNLLTQHAFKPVPIHRALSEFFSDRQPKVGAAVSLWGR